MGNAHGGASVQGTPSRRASHMETFEDKYEIEDVILGEVNYIQLYQDIGLFFGCQDMSFEVP